MRTTRTHVSLRIIETLPGIAFLLISSAAGAQVQPAGKDLSLVQGTDRQGADRRQEAIPGKGANRLAEIQTDESRIGPGDLLEISVFEAPEMNRTLRVLANGEISMELLGAVKASGLTPTELESLLRDDLRRSYMKDPHVGVLVRELESHPVSVVGAVKKPGVFQIRGTKTVVEMLSMAEGLADDAGDTVYVMRGASFSGAADPGAAAPAQGGLGQVEQVNLWALMESKNDALNLQVHPGDIVRVTSAGLVYVVGEVKRPGGFVLKNNQGISLLQALALSEGLTRTSAGGRARIIRTDPRTGQRVEIPVDVGKILANKARDPGHRSIQIQRRAA